MATNIKRMTTAMAAAGGAAGLAVVIGLSGASPAQAYPIPTTTTTIVQQLPPTTTTTTTTVVQQQPPPLPTPPPLPPVATIPATGGTTFTEGVMIGSTLAVAGFGLVIVAHRRRGSATSLVEDS